MSNLAPNPAWDNVVQLETTTRALAGPGNPMNQQAQALLNRTAYLSQQAAAATAALEATGGSALVGYDGGTTQDVLDSTKPIASYAVLRAYTGRAKGVRVTDLMTGGDFYVDAADSTSTDNGGTVIVDASGRRWKRVIPSFIDMRWWQPAGVDDSTALASALGVASAASIPLALSGVTVAAENVPIPGDLIIVGPGVIKHKAAAANPAIRSSGNYRISAKQVTFDGNKAAQSGRFDLLALVNPDWLEFDSCKFVNTVRTGFYVTGSVGEIRASNCEWRGMAEHGGTTGLISCAASIDVATAERVYFSRNRVIADVASSFPYSPGGFIVSMASGASVVATENYFLNIGQRQATNFIGSIDLYVGSARSVVAFNESENARYVPWKLQNLTDAVVIGNTVNGLSDLAAGGCMVVQNARSYANRVQRISIVGNSFRANLGNTQVYGLSVQGVDSYYDDSVTTGGNIFWDVGFPIIIDHVSNITIGNDVIESSTATINGAITITNTDQGSDAPTVAHVSLVGTQIRGSAVCGLFARTNVTNLALKMVGVTFKGTPTNYHFSVRNAKSLTMVGCSLSGQPTSQLFDIATLTDVRMSNNDGEATAIYALGAVTNRMVRDNSWDTRIGSIAYGAQTIAAGTNGTPIDVTVSGASTATDVADARLSTQTGGLVVTAWVSTTNTVRIGLFNPTGASITLAAGTATATARR